MTVLYEQVMERLIRGIRSEILFAESAADVRVFSVMECRSLEADVLTPVSKPEVCNHEREKFSR